MKETRSLSEFSLMSEFTQLYTKNNPDVQQEVQVGIVCPSKTQISLHKPCSLIRVLHYRLPICPFQIRVENAGNTHCLCNANSK